MQYFDEETGLQHRALLAPQTAPNKQYASTWFNDAIRLLMNCFSYANSSPVLESNESWWTTGTDNKVILYPGMFTTQAQFVQYVGQGPLTLSTSQNACAKRQHIEIFEKQNAVLGPEIEEVNRDIHFFEYRYQHVLQYFLGLRVAQLTTEQPDYETLFSNQESGSVVNNFGIKSSPSSLGQGTDIRCHKKKYDALINHLNPNYIIAFGVSRGAATTFAALATYASDYTNIQLCILEGPPGSISAQFKAYSLGWLYNPWIAYYFLGQEHNTRKSFQAIAYTETFPIQMPLIIISSQRDEIVCHKSSLNITCRVAARRIQAKEAHPDAQIGEVYFIQLDTAKHNYYTDKKYYPNDSRRYENLVHRIYQHLGLPYIEQYANAPGTEEEFHAIELTKGPLCSMVNLQALFKENKLEREAIRENAWEQRKTMLESIQSPIAKQRIHSISDAMPLFAKPLQNRWTLFSSAPTRSVSKEAYGDAPNLCEKISL